MKPRALTLYQCSVRLSDIEPVIWRRFVIPSHLSLAQVHEVLQVLTGWSGECLHRFRIRGKDYGINYVHGLWFPDDARQVLLSDLRLRVGARFTYEYDFTYDWKHEIRIEQVLPSDDSKAELGRLPGAARHGIPVCTAAGRGNPPEWLERRYTVAVVEQHLENDPKVYSRRQTNVVLRTLAQSWTGPLANDL